MGGHFCLHDPPARQGGAPALHAAAGSLQACGREWGMTGVSDWELRGCRPSNLARLQNGIRERHRIIAVFTYYGHLMRAFFKYPEYFGRSKFWGILGYFYHCVSLVRDFALLSHFFSAQYAKLSFHTFYRIFFLGLGYMIWVVENLGSNYQVSVVRGCVRRCSNNQFVPSAQCWFFYEIYLALFGLLSSFGIKIKKIFVKLQFVCPWNRKKSQIKSHKYF